MTAPDGGPAGTCYIAVPSAAVQAAAVQAGGGLHGDGLHGGGLHGGGLGAFLSPREHDASLRFHRGEDRLDYSASHALFRLLAAWWLGLGPEHAAGLEVRRLCGGCGSTEHGKPSIEGVGLSMSRSHGTVMAAAGPAGTSLGADIEKVPAKVFAGFDDFAVAPGEGLGRHGLDVSDASGASDAPDASDASDADRIRLWVAKEAVLKAAGVGLAVDPSAVRLDPAGARAVFRAESPGNPAVHGLLVGAVPAPPGYLAAVSARSGVPAQPLSLPEIFSTKGSSANIKRLTFTYGKHG
ncbi:4'-phosphopantetheinyl transferase family protein [Arthrobacter sp. CG_A4]|uniref:4'-phosphopantetheinyl transferase family protein n=1 Tax=Arthrobacter sp. CG_A4 TaxID=3071706 RepID=UPI002DF855CE|nr:4'-phosphopantetheinyl transferase [Arthrobacter sp. CG_A4]